MSDDGANTSNERLSQGSTLPCTRISEDEGRNGRRVGSGSRGIASDFHSDNCLLGRHELISSANSKSTDANVKRATKLLNEFSRRHNAPDPVCVTPNSSNLVMNLSAKYCRFGTADSLKDDAMGGLVQGLRILYEQNGHSQNWIVDDVTGESRGNPVTGNPDIVALRRAHRVHLARYGTISLKTRPVTAAIICDHAESFWYDSRPTARGSQGDIRDIQLHSIMVLGVHLGLRFDEVSKLTVEHISVTSGQVILTIAESIKNSTCERNYVLEEWAGNTSIRHSLFMDPFVAIFSWLTIRGDRCGPLFCEVKKTKGGFKLDTTKPLSSKKLTDFFRKRLEQIGIGSADLCTYTGHSIKRGAVQLYRELGHRDEHIMQKVQMTGAHAYANYCAAYNDCAPQELPRFTNVAEYIKHAQKITNETDIIYDKKAFDEFIREVWGDEEASGLAEELEPLEILAS